MRTVKSHALGRQTAEDRRVQRRLRIVDLQVIGRLVVDNDEEKIGPGTSFGGRRPCETAGGDAEQQQQQQRHGAARRAQTRQQGGVWRLDVHR